MIDDEIVDRATRIVARALRRVRARREVQIKVGALGKHAGRACTKTGTIEISRAVFRIDANRELLRETVLHELAHVLAPAGHGHGSIWGTICKRLGVRARTHIYPHDPYPIHCPKCDERVRVGPRRACWIAFGFESYRHRLCGAVLVHRAVARTVGRTVGKDSVRGRAGSTKKVVDARRLAP